MKAATWQRLILLALLAPSIASATTVSFELGPDPIPGFGASFIHAGTGCTGGSYYMCGDKMRVTGKLTLSDVTIDSNGTINGASGASGFVANSIADSAGPDVPSDLWRMEFTGVGFASDFPSTTLLNSSDPILMALDYDLFSSTDTASSPTDSGTFYFAAKAFMGAPGEGPNTLTLSSLILWGNNWMNGIEDRPDNFALGMDLYGTPVPIPGAVWLFGSGLFALWGLRRRQQPGHLAQAA